MPTVIDALLVTLNLKPENFTKGMGEASKAQDKLAAGTKTLDAHEKKLTETQKVAVKNLRESAVVAERAKKELSAAAGVGKEFWGALEKGALSFGAALGLAGFAEMTKSAVDSNSAIARLSTTLGMGARDADAWGKAIEQKVGGQAGDALGTIRNLNRMMQAIPFQIPTDLIMARGRAMALTGKNINLTTADNTPLSGMDIIKQFTPAVRALGQERADAVLGNIFDEGTLRFMGLSDKDQAAALAEARKNTPDGADPYGDAEKLRQETADLTQAFGALRDTVTLMAAPALAAGIRNLVTWLQWLRNPAADPLGTKRDAAIQSNDVALLGSDTVAKEIVSKLPINGKSLLSGGSWWQKLLSGVGVQVVDHPKPRAWSQADELGVAKYLLDAGVDPATVRSMILDGEAAGLSPGAVKMKAPSGPAGIEGILDGIRDLGEKSGNNAVSPKGARGRYQFIPATAARYGLTDPTNETMSREAARKYITDLYAEFHDVTKAVAAYNMGEGALRNDIKAHGANWRQFLPQETASYLNRMAPVLAGAGGGGTTITVAVNGPTTINTKATDADGLKRDLSHHWALVAQNQSGPH